MEIAALEGSLKESQAAAKSCNPSAATGAPHAAVDSESRRGLGYEHVAPFAQDDHSV